MTRTKVPNSLISIILTILSLFNYSSLAKDLGQQGNVFEIKEEGFVGMIQRKLQGLDINQHQQKLQQMTQKKVKEPTPVVGLKRTEEEREFIFDPTYVLQKDIYLPGGKLLHPTGTRVNPLEQFNIEQKLLFIDGRDQEQVEWFVALMSKDNQVIEGIQNITSEDKLILVGGRPFDLEKQLDRAVYFDQFGELVKKFGIKQVPAIVEQQGKVLKIREVNIDKDKD